MSSELLSPGFEKVVLSKKEKVVVEKLGMKYNFDVEEAIIYLKGLVKVEVKVEVKMEVKMDSKYPIPFNGEKKENCCNGIVKNHGLYTQCEKSKLLQDGLCKGCKEEPYGNINDRMSLGLYEYKDPKGKSPKKYIEVLKKLKISKQTIEEEAKRLNITINPIHFEESENVKRGRPKSEKKVKETSGKKGRPKKESKVVEVNKDEEEDLFATLIAKANLQPLVQPLVQPLEKVEPNPEQEVIVEEAKEVLAPPLPKVEEAIVEEAKEVLAPPLEKVEKVDKKAAEKAAKEAEKQKKADEKAAKEAEKAAKEAEKQKKADEKAAKEAEKKNKQSNAKDLAPPLQKVEKVEKVEEEVDVVRKIEFEGKSYYKSNNTGVIYNMDQEVVGKWNTERSGIDFEEEEEEEEYDD